VVGLTSAKAVPEINAASAKAHSGIARTVLDASLWNKLIGKSLSDLLLLRFKQANVHAV